MSLAVWDSATQGAVGAALVAVAASERGAEG